jgi:NADH:ubiquinone oxidoreductase subunit 3 (subunit A)
MTQDDFFGCASRSWSLGFGDPTLLGWATTAGYLISAVLAFVVMKKEEEGTKLFWLLLSMFILTIGLNKQLDLQSAFLAGARCIAKAQGWYGSHYNIKYSLFAILSILISISICFLFSFYKKNHQRGIGGATYGLIFVMIYIILRVAVAQSNSRVEDEYTPLSQNIWIIELLGISLILFSAIGHIKFASKTSLSDDNQP